MIRWKKTEVPVIEGEYRNIYSPNPDQYKGITTENFIPSVIYKEWIANDFSVIRDKNGILHIIGIIHPKPPKFENGFVFDEGTVHEAENQLFHAVFQGSLSELYQSGKMREEEKLMYPSERPEEPPECWAPCVIRKDDLYYMFYTPESMRLALSSDLYHFKPQGSVFEGNFYMRDPYVFFDNGLYYMIYNYEESLFYRTSRDLLNWSEKRIFWQNRFQNGLCVESPCIFKRNDIYYLLWSAYDAQNGCYDNRTFVFASDKIDGFDGKAPLTMIKGHAPEIICEDGEYYIFSVFYPKNGISIAKIRWETLM